MTLQVDNNPPKININEFNEKNCIKDWKGRKITLDNDYGLATRKITLLATVAITSFGWLLGGWVAAAAILAGGVILSGVLSKVTEDAALATWIKEISATHTPEERENLSVNTSQKRIVVRLNLADLTNNKKIFCKENNPEGIPGGKHICLLEIEKANNLMKSSMINVNIMDPLYNDWNVEIAVDSQPVFMVNSPVFMVNSIKTRLYKQIN